MPQYVDSIDKIIKTYFRAVTSIDFEYKNKIYKPKKLKLSQSIFKGLICFQKCGTCCPRFSLDFLPFEDKPYPLRPRTVTVNNKQFEVYSDLQENHKNYHCRHVDNKSGLCGIYPLRPFSCDFEIIRFLMTENENRANILTQRIYGRWWNMLRIDGKRGALCKRENVPSSQTKKEVIRRLKRLKLWCEYFQIENKMQTIIEKIKKVNFIS